MNQGLSLKISQIVQIPSVRVLLYLYENGNLRHAELSKLTTSRGTLSLSLRELEQEGLIQRTLIDTKPLQSIYSLTEKGKTIAKQLKEIEQHMTKQA
jgi:DNA-binding HxlR family transcriptional regulator